MQKQQQNNVWAIIGLVILTAGMMAAMQWDLALTAALYRPQSPVAIGMEAFGFYPLYIPPILWLATLAANRRFARWQRIALGVLSISAAAFFLYYSVHSLQKRGVAAAWGISTGVWAVLAATALWLLLRKKEWQAKIEFVCFWGTVYMLLDNVIINALKLMWSRTRFDDMLASGGFEAFTSWLRPFGNGGTSFPSGHTAAACSVFVLILLCDVFAGWYKRRSVVWAFCWAYIALMAFSRMLMGRHYLSDTLMAAFVMSLLFFAMTHSKAYQKSLQKLLDQPLHF